MTENKKTCRPWTDAEDKILWETILHRPRARYSELVQIALPRLPGRSPGSIRGRLSHGGKFSGARQEGLRLIEQRRKAAKQKAAKHGKIYNVSIPPPPFEIKVSPRDETKPLYRRTSLAPKESRYDIVKRIILEEMRA